jgi:hypothetical protein
MNFAVVTTNLRTGKQSIGRRYSDPSQADASAAWHNDMHRACKMFHLATRALWIEGA